MSLRPRAEGGMDATVDRATNAFQIRCTIAAARAAHALFERQCVATGSEKRGRSALGELEPEPPPAPAYRSLGGDDNDDDDDSPPAYRGLGGDGDDSPPAYRGLGDDDDDDSPPVYRGFGGGNGSQQSLTELRKQLTNNDASFKGKGKGKGGGGGGKGGKGSAKRELGADDAKAAQPTIVIGPPGPPPPPQPPPPPGLEGLRPMSISPPPGLAGATTPASSSQPPTPTPSAGPSAVGNRVAPEVPGPEGYPREEGFTGALTSMVTRILVGTKGDIAYTLVDGRNFFHEQFGKHEIPHTDADQDYLIRSTKDCLPARTSQVIVVWTKANWIARNLHSTKPEYYTRRKQYARMLKPLAAPGTNVIFLLYDFLKPLHQNNYQCIGRWGSCKKTTKPVKECQLPQMTTYSHLACEMDDVLLTKLDCLLTAQNRTTKVMTEDKQVLKSPADVEKLEKLVDVAREGTEDRLKPAIEIAEVPLSW